LKIKSEGAFEEFATATAGEMDKTNHECRKDRRVQFRKNENQQIGKCKINFMKIFTKEII